MSLPLVMIGENINRKLPPASVDCLSMIAFSTCQQDSLFDFLHRLRNVVIGLKFAVALLIICSTETFNLKC